MPTKTKTKKTEKSWTALLTFPVVGLGYHDYNPELLKRGVEVKLVHEPSNKYDNRAIKVMLGSRHIGYVPRTLTEILHSAKQRGCEFYAFVNQHFPNAENLNCVLYVRVNVLEPKLSITASDIGMSYF